jgi:multidrug resistance efflux pump
MLRQPDLDAGIGREDERPRREGAVTEAARQRRAAQSLAGFTRQVAPFDGVVTSRSAQIGTL